MEIYPPKTKNWQQRPSKPQKQPFLKVLSWPEITDFKVPKNVHFKDTTIIIHNPAMHQTKNRNIKPPSDQKPKLQTAKT